VLDDYVAIDKHDNQLMFSSTETNELYVILLEKAWAKACGNYANTIGGLEYEALKALTGAPCKIILNSIFEID